MFSLCCQALSCCWPSRERRKEIELAPQPLSVSYAKKPDDGGIKVQPLKIAPDVHQKLEDRTNQTFQLKLTLEGTWNFLETHKAQFARVPGDIDNHQLKAKWIAEKVHEFFFAFLESKTDALNSAASLTETVSQILDYQKIKTKVDALNAKSIARVVIELPKYQEQIHTNLIRVTDRSSNPSKLTAIVLVSDRCFYVATVGKKNEILPLESKTYLKRLLDEDACGSIYNKSEGIKTRQANCCSRASMVSIYDAQIPEAEGAAKEQMEFEMTVYDKGALNIRESRSKQHSGVFVLGLPEENKDDEFVFGVGAEGLEFKDE